MVNRNREDRVREKKSDARIRYKTLPWWRTRLNNQLKLGVCAFIWEKKKHTHTHTETDKWK